MTTTRRIGTLMLAARRYVAAHPGCAILPVARHVGPHGSTTRKLEAAIAAGDEDEASDGAYFLLRAAGMTCDTCRGMLEHPWQEYCSQECYRGRS